MTALLVAVGTSTGLLLLLGAWLFPKVQRADVLTVDASGMPARLYEQAKRQGFQP